MTLASTLEIFRQTFGVVGPNQHHPGRWECPETRHPEIRGGSRMGGKDRLFITWNPATAGQGQGPPQPQLAGEDFAGQEGSSREAVILKSKSSSLCSSPSMHNPRA